MDFIPLYSAISAFAMTFFLMPAIINVAKVKKLYDVPNGRSSHVEITPSLGGIGIFAGMIFSVVFWTPYQSFAELQYIFGALLIIFLIGVRDDILPLSPRKKLLGQIAASLVLIFKAHVMITNLYGVFGIEAISYYTGAIISLFTYIVVINSINLIDGINGLAGSIASLVSFALGLWFIATGDVSYAVLSFSLLGALIGFLKYNFTPAKVFMGDTGSLLVGIVLAVLTIHFMEYNRLLPEGDPYKYKSVPALMVSLLVLPLFDTLRVFVIRMMKGQSPFSPDRNHIHHILIDMGLSHMQATGLLVMGTALFVAMTFFFQNIGTVYLIGIIVLLAFLVSYAISAYANRQKS